MSPSSHLEVCTRKRSSFDPTGSTPTMPVWTLPLKSLTKAGPLAMSSTNLMRAFFQYGRDWAMVNWAFD